MSWSEKIFNQLQHDIEQIILDGKLVSLEDGARTLMAAYYIGVINGIVGKVTAEEIHDRIKIKEVAP